MRFMKMIFCRHEWNQRYWGGDESAYLCVKCGRIEHRKGPGGPMPEGMSADQEVPRG